MNEINIVIVLDIYRIPRNSNFDILYIAFLNSNHFVSVYQQKNLSMKNDWINAAA